jgi:branched-chain amino acid transport system ATP-binding protein
MNREILKIQGLTVTFGGLKAVDSVDFSISRNEIVSLIGPNGAGKTTIFNAITGFLKRDAGIVEFEGQELGNLRPHQIAERGMVRTFQVTSLFLNLSLVDNIRTSHHMREEKSLIHTILNTKRNRTMENETLLRAMEILEFLGLEHKKEAIAKNLPYGEQRVLEIGIGLAAEPKMLLLDEPSAGLNSTETEEMMILIRKMRDAGITILLVEHDMKLVMGISDRIVVLNFGRKISEGSPNEIKHNQEVITAYLGEKREDVGN